MFDLVPAHQQLRTPIDFAGAAKDNNNGQVYLRQPHTVIQLVEVSAPPPRRISSVINSSSEASSSYTSSSSSSSFDEEEMDVEEDEEESVCESYCSSDDYEAEQLQQQLYAAESTTSSDSDAFARRMKRILLWREHSEAPSDTSSLKRKLEEIEEPVLDNDDNVSHSSKRSRSVGSCVSAHSISSAELDMHPCPACDSFFPTLQSLRLHGQRGGSEACCVAVEYAFEQ